MKYLRHILVGFDMFANTVFGGYPGDTISYRAAVAKAHGKPFGCFMCRLLDLFQRAHCETTLAVDDKQRLLWGEAVAHGEHPL